jgi:hypothetical protein
MQLGDIWTDDVLRLLQGKHEQKNTRISKYSECRKKVSDHRTKSFTVKMHKIGIKKFEDFGPLNNKIVV